VTSTSSPSRRVDPRNPTGMRAVEARNVRAAQTSIDRAVAKILKQVEAQGITDPVKIQRLVQSELDAWGEVAKKLAIERVRDSVRKGVNRSSQLLHALKIDPAKEQTLALVSKTVTPGQIVLSTGSADAVAADLKQRLTAVLIETGGGPRGEVRTKIKEAIAGPRNRASVAASAETMEPFRQTTTEVYKLNGIATVTWYTEQDEKVCDECRARHGKRYRIDRIPEPHERCRCALLPDDEEVD